MSEATERVESLLDAICGGTGADAGAQLYLDDGEGALQLVAAVAGSERVQAVRDSRFPGIKRTNGKSGRGTPASAGALRTLMMTVPDADGGLLVLQRTGSEDFSFGDRALARLYARQLAGRIAPDGLQPRSTLWTRQLEAMQRICAQLSRLGTLHEVASAICLEARQVIDYDNARVYVVAEDGLTLEPVAFRTFVPQYSGETADGLRLQVGEGITGWAILRGEPLIVPDAARDTRTVDVPGTPEVFDESMLLVPFRYEGKVTGAIVLAKLGIGRFDHDDMRLLQILSEQAAVAIENARLLAGRDGLVAELNWMLDISQTYAQGGDELTLATLLTKKMTLAVGADACLISRWHDSAGFLRTIGSHGADIVEGPYDVLGSPMLRRVLREARPEAVQAGGTADISGVRLMRELGARTLLLLPLMAAGRTTGLVELFWVRAGRSFDSDELDVYRIMANQAGAVLENVRLLEQLRQAADVDQLTGLNNHRYLQDRLQQEAARSGRSSSPFSVLMVDLDAFKAINDSHGHADGDRVLRGVAACLKLAVRDTDVVARYGGDEFVVLMPDTREDQAQAVAKRVVAGVRDAAHELGDGTIVHIGCSAGLAVYPEDGQTPAALLVAADAAMYTVKRAGGSNVRRVVRSARAVAGRRQRPTPVAGR